MKKQLPFVFAVAAISLLMFCSTSVRADSNVEVPYVGTVAGTNFLAGQTPEGAPILVNTAREVSNLGGACHQENRLVIVPLFASDNPTIVVGYRAYGQTVSHKPDGDVFITYILEQRLLDRSPVPFAGTFTITGGTGRYFGATGGGVIHGLDHGDGVFRNSYQGKIWVGPPGR